jgi:hypothetical protein
MIEKKLEIIRSFEEADRADKAYYRSLTPHERLKILVELNRRWPSRSRSGDPDRIERVYRIIKLEDSPGTEREIE